VERDTIATRMQAAGYRTGNMGKYLNGYDSLRVPRGWDAWRGWMGSYDATRDDQNPDEYRINEDGVQKTYDRWQLHDTDYLAREATEFVAGFERPFFLIVAPNPPHTPAYVPKRYKEETAALALPRPPSFDEPDASDKPRYVQETPRLTDERTRGLETLSAKGPAALRP
jgi:N-acetylglucosamine-6-sulfatase